jgi:PKD repeat protein
VIKINSSGSLIWQKSLGGSADDYGRSAQQTLDGGYICSGYSWSNNGDVSGNHGDSDAWVVKLGNVGLIQWQKAFGGTGYEESNHVLQSSDGGFIVTCGTYSNNGDVLTNHGSSDYFILKIRPSGGILWQKSLGGGLGEVAYSSLITSDAGIVTVGFASSYDGDVTGNHGDQDFWMVKLVNSPNVTLTMNSTPTCSGVNNGTASATPSGGTGPYTYLWSNGQSTATATNLATGNYTVTVVATIGCTATAAVTVAGLPPLNISISMQTPACSSSSGSATVTASNGATPYTYKWSNNQTTATATNLAAGTYTVTVTDNNGCSATATATVASGTPPTLSISQTSPSCNTPANGSATVSASGGTTPYTYLWSNGQSTATASNLVQGTYTVTVTGGNGCTKTITATISQATALSLSATNTIAACGNLANGSITVAATGGSGPFSYAWSNGASGATVANLSAGSYTVTATAPGSCSATLTVPLSSVSAPVANFNATLNLLAASFSNSSQNANSYYWTFGDGGSSLLASPSHTYALPGNYQVCLTASSSCGSSTSCTGVSVSSTVATPLVIETGLTPATIVQTLFGNGCINVSNVTFSGNAAQIARFSGGSTNIGINNGIVLSSGRAVDAVGPNNSNGGGSGTGGSMTDADISAVNGGNSIHDLAVLEFDFVAAAPNIQFDFVFASEDYCEFIDDQYPDRFLLLVNGPGISGTFSSSSANYGLIPNTNTLVNANTINHLTNSTYYINNLINPVNTCLLTPAFGVAPSEIQFDGFTKKIKTNIPFQLGQTYHVKLKIADSGDSAYDAAVFLQAGQYSSSTVSLATPAGLSSVASGSTAVYSVPAVPDILSYTWTPPPGCSINGNPIGQAVTLPAATGASVTVTFGCGWGDLCVQANGNCIQSAPSCKSINYFGFVYSGLPLCNAATPGGDDLQSTCVYTNLNGLTGTTQGYTADAGPIGFCSQVQNGVWYGFVANSSTMTFVLTPTSTASAQGLQLALTDRAGNSLACDMGGANYYPNANVVSASNLILGEVYFLFIDGYAGDECNFTISSTPSNNGFSLPALGAINTLQGPSNTCPGSSVVLSVPAVANAIQYTWQASSGTLINGELPPLVLGATGHTVTVTVANNNSTISVRASNGCQESNISSKTIQVAALPPTILPAVTICNYDLPYNTPWGDEVYGTGLYQGILPSYNGCDSIVQQQVFVKLPIFTHLGNISICKGEVYNFCGENLTESGFNVCTFTSWQGCDSLVDFTLLVLDPTTEITGSTVICANGSTTLYGGIYSPHTFSKIWRDLNGQVVGSGVMLNVTMPGTYILTTIEGGLGLQCIEHDTVVVTQVNAQPPTVTAFGGNLDCTTTELTIGASSPNQGLQYQWSGPNNFMANQQFVNVSDGGLYLLVVTDQNGCTASSSAVVSKTGFPIDLQIIVDPSGVGCQATATPLGGVPPYTYYWTNNQTTQTASNLPSGVFVVTVSDANNCTATQTANCSAVSTFDLAGLEFFTVKPNPASTYLFVELLLAQPERVQIRLINAWGQVLFESSRQANEIHEQIDLANIAAGCYFLQVSTASGSKWEVISIVR